MSTIDCQTVHHVAHLARLRMSEQDVARFAAQLSAILSYMDQLNELDTRDVPPTAHPLPVSNVLRQDVAKPSVQVDVALREAPAHGNDFFMVPRVLDQQEA